VSTAARDPRGAARRPHRVARAAARAFVFIGTRAAAAAAVRTVAVAAVAGAALLVPACAPREGGVTRLRFWAMGREGEVVQELVRDFEREHPGIRVDVQQIPWTAAHEKLLTAHVGGSSPDVAQLGNTWIAEFEALQSLAPLGERVAASESLHPDRFFSGIWNTNVLDGEVWGVPWYVDTRLLFYRRDLLAAAGYDSMPGTWREWRRAMEAVKRVVGPDRFPIFLPLNEWNPPMILGLQAGSPILRDRHTRGAFSGPEFRAAFDFFVGLFRDGLAPPVSNTEVANVYQEFERGYIAMWITGPWNLGEFRRRLPPAAQDLWWTAPLPGPSGPASGVSMAGGSSLVLFRSSKHPDAAWKLIEFLSRPDQQARFFRLCGSFPARVEAWRDSAIRAEPCARAFEVQLGRVEPWPQVPEWEPIAIKLQDWVERAVRGNVAPAAALAGMDRETDRMLEKRRWLVERGGVGAGPGRAAPADSIATPPADTTVAAATAGRRGPAAAPAPASAAPAPASAASATAAPRGTP
jgi:multiple sugar transport system substrate-binding protein